jgi:hypothetical protein
VHNSGCLPIFFAPLCFRGILQRCGLQRSQHGHVVGQVLPPRTCRNINAMLAGCMLVGWAGLCAILLAAQQLASALCYHRCVFPLLLHTPACAFKAQFVSPSGLCVSRGATWFVVPGLAGLAASVGCPIMLCSSARCVAVMVAMGRLGRACFVQGAWPPR